MLFGMLQKHLSRFLSYTETEAISRYRRNFSSRDPEPRDIPGRKKVDEKINI